ncbi:hypothetical protein PAXRUDRAFT_40912, partial [Paxillus rubicundulus Ve08.2h10]
LMKEWTSPIYAFFDATPQILTIDGWQVHEFKCSAWGCKVKIQCYLDKKDVRSTGNMQKHVKGCWGPEVLPATDSAKDANEVCKNIVGSILCTGSITAEFERKGKGKVVYSHRQHTHTETRHFQSLMKTGRPEYFIPSPLTVSRDVKLVFARTHQRVAKMLQEHNSMLSFTTDAWTLPNHCVFVAFSVHLEHKGVPLSIPSDILEVAMVSS